MRARFCYLHYEQQGRTTFGLDKRPLRGQEYIQFDGKEGDGMERIGFLLKVKEDMVDEYKRRHAEVWPEMRAALSETGWHNYSLFMRPDGLIVGYLETPDFAAAQEGMAKLEVNTRWQTQMSEFFEALDGQMPDEAMVPLEEVFHLD